MVIWITGPANTLSPEKTTAARALPTRAIEAA
jgi:hypothetical protein